MSDEVRPEAGPDPESTAFVPPGSALEPASASASGPGSAPAPAVVVASAPGGAPAVGGSIHRAREYRAWEVALLAFGVTLFGVSAIAYFGDVNLRRLLLGWPDEAGDEQVATLAEAKGQVRRQLGREGDFSTVRGGAPLFNRDTLVTGEQAGAKVELGDGSFLELGPNTMVKLVFDEGLRLGGINRAANVEIVTGSVTGNAEGTPIRLRPRGQAEPIELSGRQTFRVEPPAAPARRLSPLQLAAVATPTPTPASPPVPPPAPEPTPVPVPTETVAAPPVLEVRKVRIVSPRRNEELTVERGAARAERETVLRLEVEPRDREVPLRAALLDARGKIVHRADLLARRGKASAAFMLKAPGAYVWEVLPPAAEEAAEAAGQPFARAPFRLRAEFVAIEALDPLVSGRGLTSNTLSEDVVIKDFDISLRWKPYGDAARYRVRLLRTPDAARPLLEKEVSGTEYKLNKDKVYAGRIFYRISAALPGGFVALSELSPFAFDFLPPIPVTPASGARVSLARIAAGSNSVMLTWQKTNFTEAYEIEVAADAAFTKTVVKQKVRENFFLLRAPALGRYWWRLRSLARGAVSTPSKVHELIMIP